MDETKNAVRKTVYLDEKLVNDCEELFESAKVNSFSQFVTDALSCYKDKLICDTHGEFLTNELTQAIRDEVRPIASRLSKGLYRYAIEIDMLAQLLAYAVDLTPGTIEEIRRHANRRVAQMRGKIDLKQILDDNWIDETEENEYE